MSKQNIAAFFKYARARHQITLNRAAGMPRPWTKDPILNKYRFTSVFRELDRTTLWFKDHVREPMRNSPDVLLATVVFRLTNRIATGEAIFGQLDIEGGTPFTLFRDTGKVAHLKRAIIANCGKGPYVTGAYIISSPPGMTKLDGVLEIIGRYYKRSKGDEPLGGMETLEGAWGYLKDFDYFGPFHSYEIVTDLRHTALLEDAPDIMTWANPGPGAHRGANRVFRNDKDAKVPREQVIDEMRELLACSRSATYWPQDGAAKDWPAWEMRDVEHTLCEFDKIERVRRGEGRPRGVYR